MANRPRRPVSRKPVGSGESPGLGSGDFSVTLDPSSTLPSPYANAYRAQVNTDSFSTPPPPAPQPSRSPFQEYTGEQFFESLQSLPAQASGQDFRETSAFSGQPTRLPIEEPLHFTDHTQPQQHAAGTAEELERMYNNFHCSQSSFDPPDEQLDPIPSSHQRMPSGEVYPLNVNDREAFDIYDHYGDEVDGYADADDFADDHVEIEQATSVRMSSPSTIQSPVSPTKIPRDTSYPNTVNSRFSSPVRAHSPQSVITPTSTPPVMPDTPKEQVLNAPVQPADDGNVGRDEISLGIGTGSAYVKYLRSSVGSSYTNKLPARLPIGVGSNKQEAYTVPKEFLRRAMNIRYAHLQPRMLASEIDDDDESVAVPETPSSTTPVPLVVPTNDSRRSSSSNSVVEEVGRIKLFVANPDSDDD